MQPIDLSTAEMLLDFSGGDPQLSELSRLQLEGSVALQNMLVNPEIGMGYLADEVGMGKTYIALGVVAMMRYFRPGLRVLYICPSRNVQEKWYGREHPNFFKTNVLTSNFKIRTPQGQSGTPSISCSTVEELIHAATTGYYGDIFVRMSTFSMAMGDEEESLERHLKALQEHIPSGVISRPRKNKEDVKKAYAKALNYLLPTFDLVVIDEAHNFKHPFQSSARNLALSRILGFNNESGESYRKRVKSALLLSATPFDLNPAHLFNQLQMVGKGHLMPECDSWEDKAQVREAMTKFMVRRLNELTIQNKPHTRNMYRREWRKGERAEINFKTDEHKLITALVQKHIGDELNREGGNPAFQMGLLASFESYAQTTGTGAVEFDGEKISDSSKDARDRHLIAAIRDSYVVEESFGQSLPHPKMDQVSCDAAHQALEQGRKQLMFVRRVKSVSEIKQKLDDEYDAWMLRHCKAALVGHSVQLELIKRVWSVYHEARKRRDEDVTGGEVTTSDDNGDDQLPAKNDTIFNWFFRGKKTLELEQALAKSFPGWPTPDALKKSLIDKQDPNILLFEFNWAAWVAQSLFGQSLEDLLAEMGESRVAEAIQSAPSVVQDDKLSLFLSVQSAFLRALASLGTYQAGINELANYLLPLIRGGDSKPAEQKDAIQLLSTRTFFCHLQETKLTQVLFSTTKPLVRAVKEGAEDLYNQVHRVEVHRQLVAQSFRTGHPSVDLYLARLSLGDAKLSDARRQGWLQKLFKMLEEQLRYDSFSSALELSRLNANLDLVIKNNLSDVYRRTQDELRVWLTRQLPSSAPVIGANGETSANRSVQARKFRMPGYPLILVSTDVFQEGEDLHTFCDSVTHYGLSSSPISIEQKTGRVDRVGAFAHRRLLSLDAEQQVADDDYIQVRFPFVKQSIEAIQVRTLCSNLNVFLASLHEIGSKDRSIDEFVDISKELYSRNEIPEQLMEFLRSPYTPPALRQKNPALNKRVKDDSKKYGDAVRHIKAVLDSVTEGGVSERGALRVDLQGIEDLKFKVSIGSARSCGEILLRVEVDKQARFLRLGELTRKHILKCQSELYQKALYRTYCIRVKDGYDIFNDVEMLVGASNVTSQMDVTRLFMQFSEEASLPARVSADVMQLEPFNDKVVAEFLNAHFHWTGGFSSIKRARSLDLIFKFDGDRRRKHTIRLTCHGDYCHFEALVADKSLVSKLSEDKLLRLTWLRNRNIDLVEFLVRPDGCLVGRVLYPSSSMNFKELIFTAYILAVEADRVEYMVKEPASN